MATPKAILLKLKKNSELLDLYYNTYIKGTMEEQDRQFTMLNSLIENERYNAFCVGYKTALSLMLGGVYHEE